MDVNFFSYWVYFSRLIVFILGLFSYLLHDGNINLFKNKSLTIKTIGFFVQSNEFAIQLVVVAGYPVFVHQKMSALHSPR